MFLLEICMITTTFNYPHRYLILLDLPFRARRAASGSVSRQDPAQVFFFLDRQFLNLDVENVAVLIFEPVCLGRLKWRETIGIPKRGELLKPSDVSVYRCE